MMEQVLALCRDARLLVAGELYDKVCKFMTQNSGTSHSQIDKANAIHMQHNEEISVWMARYRDTDQAMGEFNLENDWILENEVFSVKTSYKLTSDSPTPLWIKVEAVYEQTPLFDTIAVINETDLFNTWLPFCTKSLRLKQISNTEQLIYFNNTVPLNPRDAVLQAYSVDALERRAVVIMGQSVTSFPGIEMPPIDGWIGADRMFFHAMKFLVEPVNDTTTRIVWIANLDLKSPLPQTLLNFILRKVACFFLVFLGKMAKSIGEEGETNVYRIRIKNNPLFYQWLKNRIDRMNSGASTFVAESSPQPQTQAQKSDAEPVPIPNQVEPVVANKTHSALPRSTAASHSLFSPISVLLVLCLAVLLAILQRVWSCDCPSA
eukprot:TRINITY_DN4593_c0_g1_i3.p1 TRINITY_DN4593_c0_g1~~TRINITY_DN4593_c0_g1_i3.p1  ORF type:complete len:433 (+),score=122.31 TRINITY_DN4593_c0_g1_i3:170-1300(+)